MFKKYAKSFLEKEVTPFTEEETMEPQEDRFSLPKKEAALSSIEDPDTIISEKVTIKGELSFDNLLRIDGTFEGNLNSKGKLIIGPTGKVKSDLTLSEAFIAGKVEGNITVEGRLVLRGRAEVYGNITAKTISVDEGVTLVGQVLVSPQTDDHQETSKETPDLGDL